MVGNGRRACGRHRQAPMGSCSTKWEWMTTTIRTEDFPGLLIKSQPSLGRTTLLSRGRTTRRAGLAHRYSHCDRAHSIRIFSTSCSEMTNLSENAPKELSRSEEH